MKKLLVSLLLVVSTTVTLNISAMNALDYLVAASQNRHKQSNSGSDSATGLFKKAESYLTENYLTDTHRTFEKGPHKNVSVFGNNLIEAAEMQQHKERNTEAVVATLADAIEKQKDIQTKMNKDIKEYKEHILTHMDAIINAKIEKAINFKNIIATIKKYIPLEVLLPILVDVIHKVIIKRNDNKTNDLIFDKIKVIIKNYQNKKDPLDKIYEESFTVCSPQKMMPFTFKNLKSTILTLLTTLPNAYLEKDIPLSEKLENGITLNKIIWLSAIYLLSKDKSSNFIVYLSKKLGSSLLTIVVLHIILKELPTMYNNKALILEAIKNTFNPMLVNQNGTLLQAQQEEEFSNNNPLEVNFPIDSIIINYDSLVNFLTTTRFDDYLANFLSDTRLAIEDNSYLMPL